MHFVVYACVFQTPSNQTQSLSHTSINTYDILVRWSQNIIMAKPQNEVVSKENWSWKDYIFLPYYDFHIKENSIKAIYMIKKCFSETVKRSSISKAEHFLFFSSSSSFLALEVQQCAQQHAPQNGSSAGKTLSSRHVSSCDVNACCWDVRGDLTLNSIAQIHTSVTLLTSRDLAWKSGRLTCQHASQISAVAHISSDVTYVSSALQTLPVVARNGGNAYWKKCANGPFYTTPSHQITEISIREPTHGKG